MELLSSSLAKLVSNASKSSCTASCPLDAAECMAEEAQVMCWEQLHSGVWSDVHECWRDAYACASLLLAKCALLRCQHRDFSSTDLQHISKFIDMALIMGARSFREEAFELLELAEEIRDESNVSAPGEFLAPADAGLLPDGTSTSIFPVSFMMLSLHALIRECRCSIALSSSNPCAAADGTVGATTCG